MHAIYLGHFRHFRDKEVTSGTNVDWSGMCRQPCTFYLKISQYCKLKGEQNRESITGIFVPTWVFASGFPVTPETQLQRKHLNITTPECQVFGFKKKQKKKHARNEPVWPSGKALGW